MQALIVLQDGRTFHGESFTGAGETIGELVFNTSMTGYQEILTDPSYKGQIVTMTYPLIGNYGIAPEDNESDKIHAEAFVVRENTDNYSNWRAKNSLKEFLQAQGILGVEGMDTRAITRHLRKTGAMMSIISTKHNDVGLLLKKLHEHPSLIGIDFVKEVTCKEPYLWIDNQKISINIEKLPPKKDDRKRVAVIDCGLKINQLRIFSSLNCESIALPYTSTAEEILAVDPDGIFLSNGPGDPAALTGLIDTVRELLGKKPIFGICLGHQVLALALGCKTFKLKFGHRGGNQPGMNLCSRNVEITCENHGFAVDHTSINKDEMEITYINLNDNTIEGIKYKKIPAFSVQFHPENCPGPRDSQHIFKNFLQLMEDSKSKYSS
jgi:carbamoyl-phosphate synthase small subunit